MTWIQEHLIVLTLLLLYTGMIVHHAIVGNRKTKNMTDYYVGGRSLGGVAVGISFFATYSSTNSFVGFAGQAYSYGAAWLLIAPCAIIFQLLAWTVVAPRLRALTEALKSITIPDYIGFRFGSDRARIVAALVVIFASFLYMTAVFKGIGNLLETFLDVPYHLAIAIVFVIVMAYTAVGGFISVVKTDVVQGVAMMFAAVLIFWGAWSAAGGASALTELRASVATAPLFSWDYAMAFPVMLGIMVAGTMKFVVEPRQLSRFYALKDNRAVRRGMIVSTLAFVVVYSLLAPIGLLAHRALSAGVADSDLVVPTLLNTANIFHPVVAAFLLVAMVAAAMSSLDSVLLVMASTCERDVVGMWRPHQDEKRALRHTKGYVVLFALITAIIALNPPGGIVSLTAFSGSLYAACFLPAVVLGLHWRRGNGTAVLTSFGLGIGTLLLWNRLPFGAGVHEVFPAMLIAVGSYIGIALVMRPNESASVDRFFSKAAATSAGTGARQLRS